MKFDFAIIAHKRQRYPTVGDYFRRRGMWRFRVSQMKDRRYCWLVFLHEMIEWSICRLTGVRIAETDYFDMKYEAARASGKRRASCGCPIESEPGNDPHAPYFDAHQTATQCERAIALALGVDWDTYERAIEAL